MSCVMRCADSPPPTCATAASEMVTCDLHVLQWNDGCWQPVLAEMVTTPSLHNGARVSVVTFNVLFDFYYQEEIFSAQR